MPLTVHAWLGIVACAGHLALAVFVLSRRTRTELGLVLTLFCVDEFAWNFFELAYQLSSHRAWHWLDVSFSWLTPPLGFHLCAAFVGRARAMRPTLAASYLAFAILELWVTDTQRWDLHFL